MESAEPRTPLSRTSRHEKQALLRDLLKRVSRSFYLSLKGLPGAVRDPISLAYLLARTSDTIADTSWLPPRQRLASLDDFARAIATLDTGSLDFGPLLAGQGDPAEGLLLERAADSLALLGRLAESDRRLVEQVLHTIISGQSLDLRRFADASESNIVALETIADLEDYTYRVAGCVGDFWTRVCFANLAPQCSRPEPEMVQLGVHYGQGLQLVNILRDLPRDLRQGRCYLPAEQLRTANLTPRDLLDPQSESRLRPVYDAWLDRAQTWLTEGWAYTNAYPRRLARVRISCALPILIGQRTLAQLRTGRVLDPHRRIKVSRGEVRRLVLLAILSHPFHPCWRRLVTNRPGPESAHHLPA